MHTSRIPLTISIVSLIASAALIIVTLGGVDPESIAFYGYSLSPYLIAAWFVLMPWGEKRAQAISGSIVCVGLLTFTFVSLNDAVWHPSRSTGPIALLFLPAYFIVGGAILWPLLYVTLKAQHDRPKGDM